MQYSDDAKTEFKLNTYHDKGIVLSALQGVRYRGGNTKTGTTKKASLYSCSTHQNQYVCLHWPKQTRVGLSKINNLKKTNCWHCNCSLIQLCHFLLLCLGIALKHVYEKVFTTDNGMRRSIPKVLVVVTDGRSQDDVKKSAEKLQHSGLCRLINHCHVCFGLYCCTVHITA